MLSEQRHLSGRGDRGGAGREGARRPGDEAADGGAKEGETTPGAEAENTGLDAEGQSRDRAGAGGALGLYLDYLYLSF